MYEKKEVERNFLQLVLCNTTGFDYFLPFERTAALEALQEGNHSRVDEMDLCQSIP